MKQVKACEICHSRKVRCDLASKGFPCSKCEASGDSCLPHRRKRKRDQRTRASSTTPSAPDALPECNITAGVDIERGGRGSIPGATGYLGAAAYFQREPLWYSAERPRFDPLSASSPDPPVTVLQAALNGFAERILPCFPLVSDAELSRVQVDESLRLLKYALAASGCYIARAPRCRKEALKYYEKAKALLNYQSDKIVDPIMRIKAALALSLAAPSPPQWASLDSNYHWVFVATSLAFQSGLHQGKPPSQMTESEQRRVWHCLRTRDDYLSATQGRPRAINLKDSRMGPLRLKDLEGISIDPHFYLCFSSLGAIFSDTAAQMLRGTLTQQDCDIYEDRLVEWLRDLPEHLQVFKGKSLKPYNYSRTILHLSYLASVIVISKAKYGSMLNLQAFTASSCISGLLEILLANGDVDILLPNATFALLAAGMVNLGSKPFPAVWKYLDGDLNSIIEALTERAKGHLTAKGGLESILRAKARSESMVTDTHPEMTYVTKPLLNREFFSRYGPEICRFWDHSHLEVNLKDKSERSAEYIESSGTDEIQTSSSLPVDPFSNTLGNLDASNQLFEPSQLMDLAWADIAEGFGIYDSYGLSMYLTSNDQLLQ